MKNLFNLIIAAALALVAPAAFADTETAVQATLRAAPLSRPALQSCPPAADKAMSLSQVGQTDCCKGHKGVCGCRAGKIVCCDNTVSTDCTCHADSGIEN